MRVILLALALFLIGNLSSFSYANEKYRVEGLAPGEYVVFSSKQYKSYKCTPSDIGDLTWCRKGEKRKFLGQMVDTVTSINHRDDGEVLYISYTMSGVKFDDRLASEQIGYLQHVFDEQPRILKVNTRTPSLKNGVIAYWGSLELNPLRSDERSMIERGQATGKGYLIDYLTSYKNSVRERLPIYSISSGYGYIYLISKSPSGKGTISFRAINNQAILAELSKTAESVSGRVAELQDAFAEIAETADQLTASERLAFDRLYQDFKNDSAINSIKQVELYNKKLNSIYDQMSALVKNKEEKRDILSKIEPIRLDLKAIKSADLDEYLQKEQGNILSRIFELSSAEHVTQSQLADIEKQYQAFKTKKDADDRLKLIKDKVQRNAVLLENGLEDITNDADKDTAKTLVLKAKAIHQDTTYDDFAELDRQFSVFEKKLSDIKEFKDLSASAAFLVDKVEGELKDVIDDGSIVQGLKGAVIKVQQAIKAENIGDLKTSVSELANMYEANKEGLKEKTFDTF